MKKKIVIWLCKKIPVLVYLLLFLFSSVSPYFQQIPFFFVKQTCAATNLCAGQSGGVGGDISAKPGGVRLDMAATFLADMTEYTGAYYDATLDRIVFVGRTNTTAPQFDKDDLAVAIKSIFFYHTVPQVSIDNAPGDTNYTQPQVVNFYPSAVLQDTKFGNVMVTADYTMKEYIHGRDVNGNTIISNVPSYVSFLKRWATYENGNNPNASMGSRWYFVPQLMTLKKEDPTNSFVFDQTKMEVITQPTSSGNDTAWNQAAQDFSTDLTNNYDAYAQEVPSYVQLKQLAKIVSVVKWISDSGIATDFNWAKNYQVTYVPTPRTTTRLNTNITVNGTTYGITGGVQYTTPNTYNPDDGTATAMRTAAQSVPTTKDDVHWQFSENGTTYDAVAVSANAFRNLGAYSQNVTDLSVPVSPNLNLDFKRSYSSFANNAQNGIGNGWDFMPARLANGRPGWTSSCNGTNWYTNKLLLTTMDGERELSDYSCSNEYYPEESGHHIRLFVSSDGQTYTAQLKNQTKYIFDSNFRLNSEIDKNGNTLTYGYDSSNRLVSITDQNNHQIVIWYNGQSLISNVHDWVRGVNYSYDSVGNLTSVSDPMTNTTTYQYDVNNRLSAIINRVGDTIVQNTYNDEGKVITQIDASGNQINFAYDPSVQTITKTDTQGRSSKLFYDDRARITEEDDAVGNKILYTYGAEYAPLTVADKNQRITTYTYDSNGNTTSITTPDAVKVSYTYDGNNNLLQISDDRYKNVNNNTPRITTYAYDGEGNRLNATVGSQTTSYTYDSKGNILTSTNPLNQKTTYTRDVFGNPLTITDALNHTTTNQYDNLGRLVQQTDPKGNITSYAYDMNSNLQTKTTIDGSTQYYYDPENRLEQSVTPNGIVKFFQYNASNNISGVADWFNKTQGTFNTVYGYDPYQNVTSKLDALNRTTTYTYDNLNRKIGVSSPLGEATQWQYDANGNILSRIDANNKTTTYTYDAMNRLKTITYPNATTVSYAYDDRGNVLTMVDPLGTTTYGYDIFDRLVTTKDAHGLTIGYTYDNGNNIIKITYPDGKTVDYGFDANNRITSVTDWNNSTTSYTYDANGLLASSSLPNGITGTYGYDQSNKVTSIQYKKAGNTVATFSYQRDNMGNITQADENDTFPPMRYSISGTVFFDTNQDGIWENSTENAIGKSVAVTLTGSGLGGSNSSQILTDVKGSFSFAELLPGTYTLTANVLNMIGYTSETKSVTIGPSIPSANIGVYQLGGTPLTSPTPLPAPQINTYSSAPLGTNKTTAFNTSSSAVMSTPTPLPTVGTSLGTQSLIWTTPAPSPTPTSVPTPTPSPLPQTHTFVYDGLQRLVSAVYSPTIDFEYTYDTVGNMLSFLSPKGSASYTYNDDNELTQSILGNTTTTFNYDGNGNLLTRSNASGSASLGFNTENTLTDFTLSDITGNHTLDFLYNGTGNRLTKIVDATTTTDYVYDVASSLPRVLAETNDAQVMQNYYVYGNGMVSQGGALSSSRKYYLYDAMENIRFVTDNNGDKVASFTYDPYGNEMYAGVDSTSFAYKGEQFDPESGLYYMRARYYDPTTGGFISRDPVEGDLRSSLTQNGYSYANNDPINLSDPSGKSILDNYINGYSFQNYVNSCFNFLKNTQGLGPDYNNTIPDILENGVIGEIKSGNYTYLSSQLKQFLEYAKDTGRTFTLYIKQGAAISQPLFDAIKSIGGFIEEVPW